MGSKTSKQRKIRSSSGCQNASRGIPSFRDSEKLTELNLNSNPAFNGNYPTVWNNPRGHLANDIQSILPEEVEILPAEPSILPEESWLSDEESLIPPEESLNPLEESLIPPEESLNPLEESLILPKESMIPTEESLIPPKEPWLPNELSLIPPEESSILPEELWLPDEGSLILPDESLIPPEESLIPTEEYLFPPDYSQNPSEHAENTVKATKPSTTESTAPQRSLFPQDHPFPQYSNQQRSDLVPSHSGSRSSALPTHRIEHAPILFQEIEYLPVPVQESLFPQY